MFSTMNKIEFGQWVREERNKHEWSQADLARESGLYRSLINNIENGVSESAPKTLTALGHAFGYSVEYMFEMVGLLPPKPELSPIKRKLSHLAEGLPDSDVEIAIALLEQRSEYYKKHPNIKPAK